MRMAGPGRTRSKIVGLVGPWPSFGCAEPNEPLHIHCDLVAWRCDGGPIHRSQLRVRWRAPNLGIEDLEADWLDRYRLVGATGVISRVSRRWYADVRAMHGPIEDPAFDTMRRRLTEPVVLQTESLGQFEFDRELGWFEATVQWNRAKISLRLDCPRKRRVFDALRAAESLLKNQRAWDRRIRKFIVDQLYSRSNANQYGFLNLAPAQRMTISETPLSDIVVSPDGSFECWFEGNKLLHHHVFCVSADFETGLSILDLDGGLDRYVNRSNFVRGLDC